MACRELRNLVDGSGEKIRENKLITSGWFSANALIAHASNMINTVDMVHPSLQPSPTTILFFFSLLFYHISEPICVLYFTPTQFSLSSFLLSPSYLLALFFSLLEHVALITLFPSFKPSLLPYTLPPALLLLFLGHLLRLTAWLTARHSFSHLISNRRHPCHTLVTTGVYRFCRHPAYLGWWIWAVATQLLLCNPFCTVGYACVSWQFFKVRVPIEEFWLERMFGDDYVRYKCSTPTWMPGIN